MRILIAEDDPVSRRLLAKVLQIWDHEVIETADGSQAWCAFQEDPVCFIISDWMMPEMDGVELCRRVRAEQKNGYVYFILLTAKAGTDDLVEGMKTGADDFISKPFNRQELEVRVRAGQRIIDLEHDLIRKSNELQRANSLMHRDLEAAGEIQRALIPEIPPRIPGFRFAWQFRPCAFAAGDILDVFQLDETHWGFYILDVSGHGVPSAMLSVTLSRFLSPTGGQGGLVKRVALDKSGYELVPPAEVVALLRQRFPYDERTGLYFTMVYAVLDTSTATLDWARAGHTPPLLIRAGRAPIFFEESGAPPVGLFPIDASPDLPETVRLDPGDRFYLFSDGITEARNAAGDAFSEERFAECLRQKGQEQLDGATGGVVQAAADWTELPEFQDDVTLLALERSPSEKGGRREADTPDSNTLQ